MKYDIQKSRTTETVYEEILKLIVEKKFPPGEKINQSELAQRLKSSRTPIVKALHRLEAQGLVEHIPNRGFLISELSVLELLELFTLRESLDSIIVFELAETITDDQISTLDELVSGFEATAGRDSENLYREYDESFHSRILSFSRNSLVKKIINDFQIYNRCFTAGLLRNPKETLPEHRRLFDALSRRNGTEARDIVVAHMSKTKVLLQDLVEKLRIVGIDPAGIRFREVNLPAATGKNTENPLSG